MYNIYKITSNTVVDFAAEELKKYLRMMKPDMGEINITYKPDAKDGFRLGLMQDFGLDVSDAEDIELDDILYINTDKCGGIIAGDNPRSVLLSVYEYLRQNGCRWLMPGVDGEFIPVKDIEPVNYRFKPSCRYRGQDTAGAGIQQNLIDAIEFLPKVGMNVFMIEAMNPVDYYRNHYTHLYNETNRSPEPLSNQNVLQWLRQVECELSKRGIQYHAVGHGFTVEPFGIDMTVSKYNPDNDKMVTPEQRPFLALLNGERKIFGNQPKWTQFCMGPAKHRSIVADYVVNYAETHYSDYLHVWLGDGVNNHCECEECIKKDPSDWYIMLLNEIDEKLTAKNLKTRIMFISYTETSWPPVTEKLNNPDRFALLFAPITREFSKPLSLSGRKLELTNYQRNKITLPTDTDELFGYLNLWRKNWNGPLVSFDYHFWIKQYYDIGDINFSRVVSEDIKFYKNNGVHGVIACGSQRTFFPNGLCFYVYARTLFDTSLTLGELTEEYFSCAFGEDWKKFYDYLKELGEAFNHSFLSGDMYRHAAHSPYYWPEHAESLRRVKGIIEKGRELIKTHYNSPFRVRTVSVRLLEKHAYYAELLANALIPKVQGDDDEADRLFKIMKEEFGKHEIEIAEYFDLANCYGAFMKIFNTKTKVTEPTLDI